MLFRDVKMQHFLNSPPTESLISRPFPLDLLSAGLEPTNAADVPASNLSTDSACTYKEDFKQILLPAVYIVVFVLGLPLNAVVILKIWRTRPHVSRNNVYMLNLAIADFLYVTSLPLLIYNYASHDYWPFGEFACKLVRFQFYSNLHGSILFLTCISVHRYIGICHPFAVWHKQGGRRMAWGICAGVWVVVILLCGPTFNFAATGIQRNRTVCYDLSTPPRSVDYYPYGMALTFLGFLLPFLGVMVCYCRMAHVLCRPASYSGVSAATGEKRDRAVRMILVVAAVFCVSFLPFHLTKTMYLVVRTLPDAPCKMRNLFAIIYKSTRPFASMNSFLDPILFYFTQPHYAEHQEVYAQSDHPQRQGNHGVSGSHLVTSVLSRCPFKPRNNQVALKMQRKGNEWHTLNSQDLSHDRQTRGVFPDLQRKRLKRVTDQLRSAGSYMGSVVPARRLFSYHYLNQRRHSLFVKKGTVTPP